MTEQDRAIAALAYRSLPASVGPLRTWERCQATICSLPSSDRCVPAAAPRADDLIGEVADDLSDPHLSNSRVGVVVDLTTTSLACQVSCTSPRGIARGEEPDKTRLSLIGEPFGGDGQQTAGPVERIVLAARCPKVSFWTRRRHSSTRTM